MASDTKNVKLGVCKVTYGGVDLGYTAGGVDVTIKTETKQVNIDQFGKTPINEFIMGRTVTVKAPLAETTLFNLSQIMPGTVMISAGSIAATDTFTIAAQPTDGQTIVVNGTTVTFKTSGTASAMQVTIGGTTALTATALQAFLTATSDANIAMCTYTVATTVVTATAAAKGSSGNSLTAATGTAGASVTVASATFTGGVDGTILRVDVKPDVSVNLLTYAKVLTLHPISKAATDYSDDFTLIRAAAGGDISFSYKLDSERVYTAEFNGYPDPTTGKLFMIGDPSAVNS